MNKKFLAKLLIFCMIFTMLPMTAFAAEKKTVQAEATNGQTYTVAFDTEGTEIDLNDETPATVTFKVNDVYVGSSDTGAVATNFTVDNVTSEVAGVTVALDGKVFTVSATEVEEDSEVVVKAKIVATFGDDEVILNEVTLGTVAITAVVSDDTPVVKVEGDTIKATLPKEFANKENITTTKPAEGEAGVYKVNDDVVVIQLAKPNDDNAKALEVTITSDDITNLIALDATIILKSEVANVSLNKDLLTLLADKLATATGDLKLQVGDVKADKPEKVNNLTIKAALDVAFMLDGVNILSETALADKAVSVTVTVDNPYASGVTPVAYYLTNENTLDGNGIYAKRNADPNYVDITATHFSTVVLTEATSTPVGGGGGGSSSSVTIANSGVKGGTVTYSPKNPNRGQEVTITVKLFDGFVLESLTVLDRQNNAVELTKVSDTEYKFFMPVGRVTIKPVFAPIEGTDKKDETSNISKKFVDVKDGAWYVEYIEYVVNNGLMNGLDDTHFGPNDQTTRAQIVTVLYRLEGEPVVPNSNAFSDVPAGGKYYSEAVAWASRNDIVNGVGDGRFAPNDNVTREQIAAILYRYAQMKGYDTSVAGTISNFSDAARVSSWATDAIAWAVGEGLMNGDNGTLRPQGNATRAEIAALLMRFSENIAK